MSNIELHEFLFSLEFFGFAVSNGFCFYESLFELTELYLAQVVKIVDLKHWLHQLTY